MTCSLKGNLISYPYNINNVQLTQVTKQRDLGVLFNKDLNFLEHIENIVTNAYRKLDFIIRNSKQFAIDTIKLLYFSFVRSKLEFGSQIWDPGTVDRHSKLIETVQNKFLSYLYYRKYKKYPNYSEYNLIRTEFNILKLSVRRKIASILFISNIATKRICSNEIISRLNYYNPERVRPRDILFWYTYRTKLRENSPIIRMCNTVNTVCSTINIFQNSPNSLKKQLIIFFKNN